MRNPFILLLRCKTTACAGHMVGLTYDGRLVFFGHKSIDEIRAEDDLLTLSGSDKDKTACASILDIARNQTKLSRNWPLRLSYQERHHTFRQQSREGKLYEGLVASSTMLGTPSEEARRVARAVCLLVEPLTALAVTGLVEAVPVLSAPIKRRISSSRGSTP